MRSPRTTDHTIEKENQHKEGVKGRTIYGSCFSENDDRPYLDPEKLLSNTLTKIILKLSTKLQVNKFIILKEADLKETYSLRVQFREQVQDTPLSFTISPTPMSKKPPKNYGTKYDQNTVFVTLYLPSTISDTAVEKVFLEFGTVHSFCWNF